MKEWLIDLYPRGGGFRTSIRISAANQAAAFVIAKRMYPDYRTGGIRQLQS